MAEKKPAKKTTNASKSTGKGKPRAKKNAAKKPAPNNMVLREILAILVTTFAILSAISLFVGKDAKALYAIRLMYASLFGLLAFTAPLLEITAALWVFARRRVLALSMLHIAIVTLLAGYVINVAMHADTITASAKAGGLITLSLASFLSSQITPAGAWAVAGAIALIYARFAFKVSYIEIGRKAAPHVAAGVEGIKKAVAGVEETATAKVREGSEKRREKAKEIKEKKEKEMEEKVRRLQEEEARKMRSADAIIAEAEEITRDAAPARKPDPAPAPQAVPHITHDDRKEEQTTLSFMDDDPVDEISADMALEETQIVRMVEGEDGEMIEISWRLPKPEDWLDEVREKAEAVMDNSMRDKLEDTLKSFQVPARISNVVKGASFTRFEIELEPGTKVNRIVSLETDIALSLATDSKSIRIEAPIPGKSAIGIEVPNKNRAVVPMRHLFVKPEFARNNTPLSFVLGEDIIGQAVFPSLIKMPHLLVAGSTNSGKSVCLNCIISSILAKESPDDIRFIMVDMKRVELTPYDGVPHLLSPIITEAQEAASALRWICEEMDRRYKLYAQMGVRNIDSFNAKMENPEDKMHRIVVVIDELADLMIVSSPAMNIENYICRITQLARATGIHAVLATQRPDTKVITGTIKNNIPSRIAFGVASQIDSRTIIDQKGAESLLGRGDMLFLPFGSNKLERLQGAYLSDNEVNRLVDFWKAQVLDQFVYPLKFDSVDPGAMGGGGSDEFLSEDEKLYKAAVEIVVTTSQASISMIQRRLRIGYNRAARLVEQMEERGVVGSYDGSRPREVLLTNDQFRSGEY